MNTATIAEGEKVPDIQALGPQVQDLGDKIDWWNNAIIWVLVFAALVAVGTVLATYMAFKRAKQFADAQGDLSAAKEKALAEDLSAKELKIEGLKRETAIAQKDAGVANQRAEELKQQNLKMEATMAPRVVGIIGDGKKLNVANLIPLGGTKVIMEVLPDPEAERAASGIFEVLEYVKWPVVNISVNSRLNHPLYDGVTVVGRWVRRDLTDPNAPEPQGDTREVAKVFAEFLKSSGWEAKVSSETTDREVPPSTIKIKVGLKPNPYVLPQLKEAMERFNRAMEQHRKETNPK